VKLTETDAAGEVVFSMELVERTPTP
jgi:hypothetical protein